ncbi:LysR family transcriptional regulator [Rhodoplanes elegans]|uniref:LysR family transcriptional regulator n=1 Tax=Rhodoplanes elegans TaxID=29408 RepID=A0A327KE93_9BRAD|nr:hydrogen peroxide-inducible genes activator [Rhodoplanes elegans]MBK5962009.1 LysR family transcriptional regulator [Rhodoplanes elegans]RAI37070.1 LysR family transcriptional regulator [Rhodoplanes elegans]
MITLKQLRYFGAVARTRHFGRAAADCAVSQPALSMQIRDLEARLGVELVERRPGDVTLTPVGVEIARRAEELLAGARDLEDFARHHAGPLAGTLRLGVIPTLAPYVLPKVLPALQRQHPALTVELRESQTRTLVDELGRGLIDVVMLALPVEQPEIETLALFEDPFVLAVPAADPRPAATPVAVGAIAQERLLLLEEGHCLRDQALAVCANGRGDAGGLGATSLATVVQLVASGYGATLLPQVAAAVERDNTRIKLLRFAAPEPGRTIALAYRRTSPRKADFSILARRITGALGVSDAGALPTAACLAGAAVPA